MADNATSYDDAERLRRARQEADEESTRPPGIATGGSPCVVGRVTAAGTAAQRYCTLAVQTVLGPEVDGGAGTLTDAGFNIKALNVGSAVPAVGATFICSYVSYRWIFSS